MKGPTIVTGPDRSGTSLLYVLLGNHPGISMIRRSNMFRWFQGRFGDLGEPENPERFLQTMLHYQRPALLDSAWRPWMWAWRVADNERPGKCSGVPAVRLSPETAT